MRPSDIKYVMEIWHSHLPKPEEDLQDSIFKLSLRQLHEILSEVVIDQANKPRAKEAEANHHQPPYSSRQDPQIPSYEEQAQEPTMRVVNHWHQQPYHRGIPDPPPWADLQQEEEEQQEEEAHKKDEMADLEAYQQNQAYQMHYDQMAAWTQQPMPPVYYPNQHNPTKFQQQRDTQEMMQPPMMYYPDYEYLQYQQYLNAPRISPQGPPVMMHPQPPTPLAYYPNQYLSQPPPMPPVFYPNQYLSQPPPMPPAYYPNQYPHCQPCPFAPPQFQQQNDPRVMMPPPPPMMTPVYHPNQYQQDPNQYQEYPNQCQQNPATPPLFQQQRDPKEMAPPQQPTMQMPPTEYQDISTSKPEDYSCNSQTVKTTVIDATVIDAISIKPEDDDEEEPVSLKEVNPVSPKVLLQTDSTFSVPETTTSKDLAIMKADSPLKNLVSTETMELVFDHFSTVRPPEMTLSTNERASPFTMMQVMDYFHRARPPEMTVVFHQKTWFDPFALLDYFSRTRPPELM